MNMGITLATFRRSGYIPVCIERLKSFTSAGARIEDESLMNLVEKLSKPVEFVFFSDFIILMISDSVVLNRNIE